MIECTIAGRNPPFYFNVFRCYATMSAIFVSADLAVSKARGN